MLVHPVNRGISRAIGQNAINTHRDDVMLVHPVNRGVSRVIGQNAINRHRDDAMREGAMT